jgi:hypothetical protein
MMIPYAYNAWTSISYQAIPAFNVHSAVLFAIINSLAFLVMMDFISTQLGNVYLVVRVWQLALSQQSKLASVNISYWDLYALDAFLIVISVKILLLVIYAISDII